MTETPHPLRYADPAIRYAVSRPDGDLHDVLDTSESAWRAAAIHVLDPDNEHDEREADRQTTAFGLLEMNDVGVMWGWRVTRYADTKVLDYLSGSQLGAGWAYALTVSCPAGSPAGSVYDTVAKYVVTEMLGGDDEPVDVAVVTDNPRDARKHVVTIGLVTGISDDGELVFTDGHKISVENITSLSVTYR